MVGLLIRNRRDKQELKKQLKINIYNYIYLFCFVASACLSRQINAYSHNKVNPTTKSNFGLDSVNMR